MYAVLTQTRKHIINFIKVIDLPYKMKYWRGIYFGRLTDFSATTNINSAINLATEYVDVITHVDQLSNGKVAVHHADA